MKRYKVVEDVITEQVVPFRYNVVKKTLVIPAGTEICLEEVKEEKEIKKCSCHNDFHEFGDQPKEEKEFNAEVMVGPKHGD